MSKFYTLDQNNSGGYFERDEQDGIAEYVFIEANNPEEARERAEDITCGYTNFCPCCGERWYINFDENDGHDEPTIYGKSITKLKKGMFREQAYIHYLDGNKIKVVFP